MVTFRLEIEPVAKGRAKRGKFGNSYTPPKTRKFEDYVKKTLKEMMHLKRLALFHDAIYLEILFYIRRPKSKLKRVHPIVRPDLDNYLKSLLDSMNETVVTDDSIIVALKAEKKYAPINSDGYIEIKLNPLY